MGSKTSSGSKGNGASKRMGNEKRKARMSACHARGEKRKKENDFLSDARAHANVDARRGDRPTPVDTARMLRAARREPLQRAFKLWSKSYAEWLASDARRDAVAVGEAIRRDQKNILG